MSSTMVISTPDSKHNGGGSKWRTPRNGNHLHAKTAPTTSSRQTPSSKRLTIAEKLALREKARVAMTPPGQREEEAMEYKTKPQRTPLSMAIAMKAATSPTVSSFPDSFWTPFLEQEEYDRQQMSFSTERRRQRQPEKDKTARRLNLSLEDSKEEDILSIPRSAWVSKVTKSLRYFMMTCVYLALGLFFLSILDAPYLHRFLETSALAGRLFLGISFWLYDFIANSLLQDLSGYYEYLTTDGLDDFYDLTTDLQMQLNNLIDRLLQE